MSPLTSRQVQIAQIASPGTTIIINNARMVRARDLTERIGRDINGVVYQRDVPYLDPDEIEIEFYITSISQEDLNNLWELKRERERVRVTDGATTSPEDKAADAYYRTYDGIIIAMPEDNVSPGKSAPGPFTIRIQVDTTTRTAVP